MTATFARWFVIKSEADKRSASFLNLEMRPSTARLCPPRSVKSEGDNEKKATSAADAKPDTNRNTTAHTKATTADTVGAGDSFTATFVASILKGKTVSEAHKLAVEVSAYVCTQNGAMPELPDYLKDKLG